MPPSSPPAIPATLLLAWYRRHRRDLPWRAAPGADADPYRVWVSEVMLQQTRVQAAIPYYQRFLERFPTLAALAAADEADVLALWSGLGYYRRARQLRQAAELVMARHGGVFPMDWAAARALPGVGAYTAGAILSIAGRLPLPAVDGNALRIARRVAGQPLSLAAAQTLLATWLSPRRPGEFNQALMDLGATVCLPRAPRCPLCPLRRLCRGQGQAPASSPAPRLERVELAYVLARRGARVWLVRRRRDAGQLAGMWELPRAAAPRGAPLATLRHSITTRRITATIYAASPPAGAGRWMSRGEALSAPLTGLARKILRQVLGWQT